MQFRHSLVWLALCSLAACSSNPVAPKAAEPAKPAAEAKAAEATKPAAEAKPATEAAAPAASSSGLKLMPLPPGHLAIHYYRPAKDYAPGDFSKCDFASCWGIHAWGDAYDQDTSWFKPVFPAGVDDFGAVYHIKANSDAGIAKGIDANYIIHKADAKDQCSKDMSFSWEKSKEIFVVSNDCHVYYSVDEALNAMKK